VAGGELGLDAGFMILDVMGIGFLLRQVFGGISDVFTMVKSAMEIAWNAGSNPARPPMADIQTAAYGLADANAEMVSLLLQGVLIWILSESAVARAGKLVKEGGKLGNPAALAARGNQVLNELRAKPAEMRAVLREGVAELAGVLRRAGELTRGLADFVEAKFEVILKNITEDAGKQAEQLKRSGGGGGAETDGSVGVGDKSGARGGTNKKTLDQIPHARRNGRLAGGEHPKTGVPFNEKGYPVFDSAYDVDLPEDLQGPDVSDNTQFKYATGQLKQEIADNPAMADQFTPEQLEQINNDSPKIDGYTWHHNENGVTLQMVDQDTHALTGHDGGRALTGGRP
jgi:hypothetical protein